MKTVAIVGTSENTRGLAPYNNKAIDIWMFNSQPLADWVRRVDLLIEMHKPETFLNEDAAHNKWLKHNTKIPVYLLDAIPEVTAGVKYPLNEIVDKYLKKFIRENEVVQYFTSSVCYAIALAIYQGYSRIELYGVDMANNTEYIYQRDGIGLWVGIALGRGIQVYIPRMCAMFNSPRYGYDDALAMLNREDFEKVASEILPLMEEAFGRKNNAEGVLDGILAELEVARVSGMNTEEINGRYSDAMQTHIQSVADYSGLVGQYHLARQFQAKVERQMEAAGFAQEVIALKKEAKPI